MRFYTAVMRILTRGLVWTLLFTTVLMAQDAEEIPESAWKPPYPIARAADNTIHFRTGGIPRYFDPARSYSSDESLYLDQVFAPLFQYHYLKRPYVMIPHAAREIPTPEHLDEEGNVLPEGAPSNRIARSRYTFVLRDDLRYQPHPAFATDKEGKPAYPEDEEFPEAKAPTDLEHLDTRAVTAADYVYQWKRIADPANECPIRDMLIEHIPGLHTLGEEIESERNRRAIVGELDLRDFTLPGITVIDDHRFSIEVDGQFPQLLNWMCLSFFAPVPWESIRFYDRLECNERYWDINTYPIASGPFYFASIDFDAGITLARNPNYYPETYPADGEDGDPLEDAGKRLPLVDRAVFHFNPYWEPSWDLFARGYYSRSSIAREDMAESFDPDSPSGLKGKLHEHGVRLVQPLRTSTFYFAFNMTDPRLGGTDGKKIRQAISIALNLEEYVDRFFGGNAAVAHGPLPPGFQGTVDGDVNPITHTVVDGTPKRRALAEAKKLLTEAGYPDGVHAKTRRPLKIRFTTSFQDDVMLGWLIGQFARIGIELVPDQVAFPDFLDRIADGDYQMASYGWNADYPDPDTFLFLFYGPNAKTQGGENTSNYRSDAYDELYEKIRVAPPGEQRNALIQKAIALLREDAPWVWGTHPRINRLIQPWVRNYKTLLMVENSLKYLRVDTAMRAKLLREWNPGEVRDAKGVGGGAAGTLRQKKNK
jgi:ABC-type transport system substrate-binding protein